jgi:nicotinate-nucleotide pyrophosphorylase (carboxylating)
MEVFHGTFDPGGEVEERAWMEPHQTQQESTAQRLHLEKQVQRTLAEDVGAGDLTAFLIPEPVVSEALILVRESAVLCGQPWVNEVFRQLDSRLQVDWKAAEGAEVLPGQEVATLKGPARALLTGERAALNFLQTLSGVATQTRQFVRAVAGTRAVIVDTRKTIPGLRLAEKYAVRIGGGTNHRMGLYDAILIKENHIAATGSITQAITLAQNIKGTYKFIQVEVETLEQLEEALIAGANMVMLDNMSLEMQRQAVMQVAGRARVEVSGGVNLESVRQIAELGVDRISIGSLTKDIKSIDFSMRFKDVNL